MPKKKKPVAPWFREDLLFDGDGTVREISSPKPSITATPGRPAVERSHTSATPPIRTTNYTVTELAKEWNLSVATIREMFRNEPGVIKLKDDDFYRKRKRPYVVLRIPPEVAQRVKRRLST
jgi:hypothetical protein